jgi:hypothetical protein
MGVAAAHYRYAYAKSNLTKPAMLMLTMLLHAEMHLPALILGMAACASSCTLFRTTTINYSRDLSIFRFYLHESYVHYRGLDK